MKAGKAPLAVGDMLDSLPETNGKYSFQDITSDIKNVDNRKKLSTDCYAWINCNKICSLSIKGKMKFDIRGFETFVTLITWWVRIYVESWLDRSLNVKYVESQI